MSQRPLMGSASILFVKNLWMWPRNGKQKPGFGSLYQGRLEKINLTITSTHTVTNPIIVVIVTSISSEILLPVHINYATGLVDRGSLKKKR